MLKIQLVLCLIMFFICLSLTVYSFNKCGWGMFAYENSFIAAITGECAQQQNKK
jgi:hypothetical protein